jgi:O-antigen ligase
MMLAPAAPWHGWRGILLIVAGLAIVLLPPRVGIPRLSIVLATVFALLACMVFLPANWFPVPGWRELLPSHGLSPAPTVTAHPLQTAECMAGIVICLIVMLYLTGHRADHGGNHILGMIFAVSVAVVALFAMAAQKWHWEIPWAPGHTFGFFLNRNHTATLLVMGSMAGMGVVMQSVRIRTWGSGILALSSVAVCVLGLIAWSESRAGIVLLAGMFAAWLLILGREYLRGRVLVAAGLLAVIALLSYAGTESAAKRRLQNTADHISSLAGSGPRTEDAWKAKTGIDSFQSLDLRLPIYLDTLDMLRHEPWTGVGAGQFQYIFPQYRHRSAVLNDKQSVHPENDWLLMAAETGIPATLTLIALLTVCFGSALRSALGGRARALRTGCLLAALVVPVHGFFDVPGHRMELVWPACWLLAISLRGSKELPDASRLCRAVFRVLGLGTVAAGVFLVYGQWFGGPAPAMLVSRQAVEKVTALYTEEMTALEIAEKGARPPVQNEDRLEKALQELDKALKVVPLDPHLHYLKGAISIYFDDKDADAERSFALARLLDPTWVALPLMQAAGWAPIDAVRTESLWVEAMKRAATLERIDPSTPHGRAETFALMMTVASDWPELGVPAFRSTGGDGTLLEKWASGASRRSLDALMPSILSLEFPEVQRQALFQIWYQRGSKEAVSNYAHHFQSDLLKTAEKAVNWIHRPVSTAR